MSITVLVDFKSLGFLLFLLLSNSKSFAFFILLTCLFTLSPGLDVDDSFLEALDIDLRINFNIFLYGEEVSIYCIRWNSKLRGLVWLQHA